MKEFADLLGGQPPFDALDADDLARLAARVEVEYFATGAVVVAESEDRLTHLWVVRTGALEVLDRGQVVDLLGPGDTFGHLWLLADLPPGCRCGPRRKACACASPTRGRSSSIRTGCGSPPSTRLPRPDDSPATVVCGAVAGG